MVNLIPGFNVLGSGGAVTRRHILVRDQPIPLGLMTNEVWLFYKLTISLVWYSLYNVSIVADKMFSFNG